MPFRLAVLILTMAFLSCGTTRHKETTHMMIFPDVEWSYQMPYQQNRDAEKLEAALDTLRSFCGKDGIHQTIIVRNGYVIFEGDSTHKINNIIQVPNPSRARF